MKYQSDFFKNKIEPQLAKAETADEMLKILQRHYQLDQPLGMVTSLAFRQGLKTAIKMLNPTPITHVQDFN